MTVQAPPLGGLTLRTYRDGDAAAVTSLFNRGMEADGVPWRASVEEFANDFAHPNERFDATRDLAIVELDGEPIAYRVMNWVDTTDGLREFRIECIVDPAWRRRGIGAWLQAEAEAHARARAAALPTERPQVLGSWQVDSMDGAIALLRHRGYEPVRYFFEMLRPTLDAIEVPPLPEGLEVRPVAEEQYRQLWAADIEAFRDHWGGFDDSEDRYRSWLEDPKFDPSLFVIAWDGDEIAGGVLNEINTAENEAFNRQRGWLASVFVRRPWRRRGLAAALVARSLVVLRDRGMTAAGLGVDAENPTGALGLYERAGFEVEYRSTAFRRPL